VNLGWACFSANTGFAASAFAAVYAHDGRAVTIARGMPGATAGQLAQAIANGGHCTEGACLNGGYGKQVQKNYNELIPVIDCLYGGH
jgi:hypothetical protein